MENQQSRINKQKENDSPEQNKNNNSPKKSSQNNNFKILTKNKVNSDKKEGN